MNWNEGSLEVRRKQFQQKKMTAAMGMNQEIMRDREKDFCSQLNARVTGPGVH